MRPGLALVGVTFLVLAGATLLAFNFTPTTTTSLQTSEMIPADVPPGQTGWTVFPGPATGTSDFVVTWNATLPLTAALYPIAGCTPPGLACAQGTPVDNWSGITGTWTTSGAVAYPYLLEWHNAGNGTATISAVAHVTIATTADEPILERLVVNATALTLAIVGGLAVFLGLFLRAGFLRGPPTPVSRGADDASMIARSPPPPGGEH